MDMGLNPASVEFVGMYVVRCCFPDEVVSQMISQDLSFLLY